MTHGPDEILTVRDLREWIDEQIRQRGWDFLNFTVWATLPDEKARHLFPHIEMESLEL